MSKWEKTGYESGNLDIDEFASLLKNIPESRRKITVMMANAFVCGMESTVRERDRDEINVNSHKYV